MLLDDVFVCHQSSHFCKIAGIMQHKTDYVLNYKKNIRSESTLVLILLNYHLPCFTPQLWGQGISSPLHSRSCFFLMKHCVVLNLQALMHSWFLRGEINHLRKSVGDGGKGLHS